MRYNNIEMLDMC